MHTHAVDLDIAQLSAVHDGRRKLENTVFIERSRQRRDCIRVIVIKNRLGEWARLVCEHSAPRILVPDKVITLVGLVHDNPSAPLQVFEEMPKSMSIVQILRGIQAWVGINGSALVQDDVHHFCAQAVEKRRFPVVRMLHCRAVCGDEPVRCGFQLFAEAAHLAHVASGAQHDLHARLLRHAYRAGVLRRDAALRIQQRSI